MNRIIDYILLQRLSKVEDINIKIGLIKIKNEMLILLNKNKFTKSYLQCFIDQYDTDQLIKIKKLIDIDLKKRAVKGLNNEL